MTFAEIINLWPSAASLAVDIGQPPVNVRTWRQRNSIPPRFWQDILASARMRQLDDVTLEALSKAAQGERAA